MSGSKKPAEDGTLIFLAAGEQKREEKKKRTKLKQRSNSEARKVQKLRREQ